MPHFSDNCKIENLSTGVLTYLNNNFSSLVLKEKNVVWNAILFNTDMKEVKEFLKRNQMKLINFEKYKLNEPYKSDRNYKHSFTTYTFKIKFQWI
jgi:hypothetical protein